ncbi:hypothetical protein [Cyclobacterium lianum]|nr:hypothetical protein [Cyclobacterium lianum]
MIAILTGDIKESRKVPAKIWMQLLKTELDTWGKAGKDWEIYRGDSFQLKVAEPEKALQAAIRLKAGIKSQAPLDIRIGIGLGEEDFRTGRLLENNGTAYVHSGEAFEELSESHQDILIKSPFEGFDQDINLMLKLAMEILDTWTEHSAKTVYLAMTHPEKTQTALGKLEGISQHAISGRLSRARFDAIRALLVYFPLKLKRHLS